jgi:hypothetical protein
LPVATRIKSGFAISIPYLLIYRKLRVEPYPNYILK